jgi:hypothetical protein
VNCRIPNHSTEASFCHSIGNNLDEVHNASVHCDVELIKLLYHDNVGIKVYNPVSTTFPSLPSTK